MNGNGHAAERDKNFISMREIEMHRRLAELDRKLHRSNIERSENQRQLARAERQRAELHQRIDAARRRRQ